MGEAKRRKKLDPNYGKKVYSIEFIDLETWQRDNLDLSNNNSSFLSEMRYEELEVFNKLFWATNIIIEDSKYSFVIFVDEMDEEGVEFQLAYKDIENPRHKRIIEQNFSQIRKELIDKAQPQLQEFLVEEMKKRMLEDDFDDYDSDYYEEDDEDDDYDDDYDDEDYDDDGLDEDYYDDTYSEEYEIKIDGDQFFDDPDIPVDRQILLSSDQWIYRPLNEGAWTRGQLEHLAQAIASRETNLPDPDQYQLTDNQKMIVLLSLSRVKTKSEVYQKLEKLKGQLEDEKFKFTDSVYEIIEKYLEDRQTIYEEIMEKCLSKGIYRYHFIPDCEGGIIDYKTIEYKPNFNLDDCHSIESENITLR